MPLFLITSLYDEGIAPNLFRVVEGDFKQAIAQPMLEHPEQWAYCLDRSLHEDSLERTFTTQQLLERLERTHVDDDSVAQLRLSEITIQSLNEMNCELFFQRGAMFSDFG